MTSRLAIVTGAASGISQSIAKHFLGEALRVVGLDIPPRSPFAAGSWTGLSGDVSDERAWVEALEGMEGDLGALDILVNAAGISARSQQERRCPRRRVTGVPLTQPDHDQNSRNLHDQSSPPP